ncbi:Cardiolipin synthetase [Minicystis rosea]|nr:Cardiolipin synthetase [Minicystis rosea]
MPLDILVEPDDGEAGIVAVIAAAQRTIRVMAYQIGPGHVLDALAQQVRAGREVRLLLDASPLSHNENRLALLRAAGLDLRPASPRFEHTHAKVIIADDTAAVISTGNFVEQQAQGSRNYAAIDRDPEDLASLLAIFDADWDLRLTDQRCARLVIAPDNARAQITHLFASARHTLDIESMELADDELRNIIAARRAAGVRVRVVLADPRWVSANQDAAAFLAEHGIRARYLTSPGVHAKAAVVDGTTAFIGSINFSYTSLNRNREVGVIVEEPQNVARIKDTIARDFQAATPFSPFSPWYF